jgi:hypothetical protein
MPEFRSEINIDPSEYIDSCSRREIERLVELLEDDGHITKTLSGIRRPNINDKIFLESLQTLTKCRHLLSIQEEKFINKLGEKLKYLG